MEKVWSIERQDKAVVQSLQDELGITAIAAKILAARGFSSAKQATAFLQMDESIVHDPFLMQGMTEAVARIHQALDEGEHIRIYGDYDADGITSTTVLMTALLELGANVDYVIPNRFTHGYGPNTELFRQAHEDGVDLLITVDNGISGVEQVKVARELGLAVIITDHHEPGDILPDADVIVHPRIPLGHYPFGELAGVGVAFKLAHALYEEFPAHLVGLVALGTVADLVPLVDENRWLVQQGIKQLQHSSSYWIKALCEVTATAQSTINEETLAFYFAPRLNAVGRLQDAAPGVDFLLSETMEQATHGAALLETCNKERKKIVDTITEQAIAQVVADDRVIVVAGEGWNAGVVGIVASRIVERFYRPTIVLGIDKDKGIAKGSARSIEGFHLYNELAKNKAIVPHFGGHPMAAGMTLPLENVDALRQALNEQAQQLTDEQLTPRIAIDVALTLDEISVHAIEEVAKLGPFGTDFPKPLYALEGVEVKDMRKIGASQQHLKLTLAGEGTTLDAIGFSQAEMYDNITYGTPMSFVGDLQLNEWQGNVKPQFLLKDMQVNTWQLFDVRGIRQVGRWLNAVPTDAVYVAFNEATRVYFSTFITASIELAPTQVTAKTLVLLDLPQSEAQLAALIMQSQPQRIYVHFHTEASGFTRPPTREDFGWYYKFLVKRPDFALQQHIEQLAAHKGWAVNTIKFMTRVFFELGFVKIDNERVTVVQGAPKTPLTSAPSYQQRSAQIEMEQQFVYAPYAQLKQWFDERLQSACAEEETAK
ncbi:recombinase RecJ [Lysinibacillus sp. BF-4]|uniref:single-stranded-DNA-specific exonuclease RecJ n=1 Tax=Lysinibacillus sp. BF-4 TaxID=1473546 RepID=UPI0005031E30|nr:single-stranded-DNA-specific exonuclease RecJ [Lysinibacillus sp. BF-4]KFL44078.1 recombinase RecJ [Lysinibacillus sp. BF-4]